LLPSVAYSPGYPSAITGPLARFLPQIPLRVISPWLQAHIAPGSLILDPFGSSPRLVVEAAQAGYRVLVAANNPVTRFLIELSCANATDEQLRATLAELASMRKGSDRIEPLIRSLYATKCEKCGEEIEAHTFLWERGANVPYGKLYTCPSCGDAETRPVNEQDIARAAQFAADKLHRARALERVTSINDPDRPHAEEALETYLPRAVYALFTLINKLDGMNLDTSQRMFVEGLLLSACDQGNCLWSYPGTRVRPKSLSIPPRFRENNIWLALENAIQELLPPVPDLGSKKLSFTHWPDLPPESGGISLYEGRLKELIDETSGQKIDCVFGAIPRPNQAFWTLSALWAGWLWGREAVAPFKNVLRRRRYDWTWNTIALQAALDHLSKILSPGVSFLGLVGEAEASYLSSVLIAAANADFSLTGLALRAESSQAQIVWQFIPPASPPVSASGQELSQQSTNAALTYLEQRGEPANYLQIHTAALVSLAARKQLVLWNTDKPTIPRPPADTFTQVSELFENAFSYRTGFLRYGGSDKSLEIGQWWLRSNIQIQKPPVIPLADRIETTILHYLIENPGGSLADLDRDVCGLFSGLFTPSVELLTTCLQSYGFEEPVGSDHWFLRSEDIPTSRQKDIAQIRKTLASIASPLGFMVTGEGPMIWVDPEGQIQYVIYLIESAAFGDIMNQNRYPPPKCIIVMPGSRANLVLYKLRRNPYLNQNVTAGWRFIKFRHVYQMVRIPTLSRDNLDDILSQDPFQETDNQIRLL